MNNRTRSSCSRPSDGLESPARCIPEHAVSVGHSLTETVPDAAEAAQNFVLFGQTIVSEFRRSWRVLCASLVGLLFCGLPGAALGMFITPWANVNHWSLSAISAFTIFLGVGASLTDPAIGRWIDRQGSRRVALVYIPMNAGAVALTSLVGHSVWSLYTVMFVWGCVSAGATSYIRAINVRFCKTRGTAMGIVFTGIGLGSAIGPPLGGWFVDSCGCRLGYLLLAAVSLLAWPITSIWLHEAQTISSTEPEAPTTITGHTRDEALRAPVFWLISAAFFLLALTCGGGLFLVPFLTEHGMSRTAAGNCAAVLGMSATIAQPVLGIASDRLSVPIVSAFAFLAYATCYVLMGILGIRLAIPIVIFLGIAQSAWISASGYCIARYFGMKCFGEISGLVGRLGNVGLMIGPLGFGLMRDATGAYTIPYLVVGLLSAAAAICMGIVARLPLATEAPDSLAAQMAPSES